MEVIIDEQRVDESFEDDDTVEQAVRHLQAGLSEPGRVVVALRCDGQDIAGPQMASTLGRTVASVDCLEVFTDTAETLVRDAMAQAGSALEQTEMDSRRAAQLLTEGRTSDGIEALSGCIGVWQQIHEAVAKSIEMMGLDASKTEVNGEPLEIAIGKPKGVLLQVRDALQSQDHVLLADILQYEFDAVVEQWHAIITTLREEARSRSSSE